MCHKYCINSLRQMVEIIIRSEFTEGPHLVRPEWTLGAFAQKLEYITGIPPDSQKITLSSPEGDHLYTGEHIESKSDQLESLKIPELSTLLVEDTRSRENQVNLNEAGVALPVMTREEYEKRPNTIYQFKREHKLGQFAEDAPKPAWTPSQHHIPTVEDVPVKLNEECFVTLSSGKAVRGTVAFIGNVPNGVPGTRVGVRLFTPDGKNNGVVRGIKLFDAEPNYGILVSPFAIRPLGEDEEEL